MLVSAAVSRPILIDPKGGPVDVAGQILHPGSAPLKIDLWRHVRHPPPELVHVATIKQLRESARLVYQAGEPAALIGKVITWVWVCSHLQPDEQGWKVRIDVSQGGESVSGYPVEYAGPLPRRRPLAELRISEKIQDVRGAVSADGRTY